MMILTETERLILRRFTKADAHHLYELDNDPEVMRFINGGVATPYEVIENDILPGFLRYDEAQPAYGFWAAESKSIGEFLGWFSFRPSDANPQNIALGYRFRRTAWGNGYATEGARALIDKAFTELDAAQVSATTYEENLASRRVMEKLGMTLVRRFRLTPEALMGADTFHTTSVEMWAGDDVEYVLEKTTWEQNRNLGTEGNPPNS